MTTTDTTPTATVTSSQGSSQERFEQLQQRLAPVFEQIAAEAAQREADRQVDRRGVDALVDAGYTTARVPVEFGGSGLSFEQFSALLVELGAADSNLAQALRAHVLHLEGVLVSPASPQRDTWLQRIGGGVVVGNAITEVGNAVGTLGTTLRRDGEGVLRLNGTKFYSTGTLYADWIMVSAVDDDGEEVTVTVPVDAPGVQLLDDWDGFGQRLSASGTTVFEDVAVDPENVSDRKPDNGASVVGGQAVAQWVHLGTLAGIGQAVVRDAAGYVGGRSRSFSHGVGELPREDPQVLQVVGEISAGAFGARAAFDAVLPLLAGLLQREAAGDRVGIEIPEDELNLAYVRVYQAQQVIAKSVSRIATEWFEVGGASAVSGGRGLDRHWRNARVLANHNPLIYRARILGDWEVNAVPPSRHYRVGG
ncbi:acyl-CoA dehydrogenase family protein [Micrococcus sp. IITD107]|uniref:acyl-CoA dehydrogenase family protein n=1 Tax=Micrococcus sp. IITD107 TaxID=3342790 RepID=UPI0035B9609C